LFELDHGGTCSTTQLTGGTPNAAQNATAAIATRPSACRRRQSRASATPASSSVTVPAYAATIRYDSGGPA
jgi:hypothetical protein